MTIVTRIYAGTSWLPREAAAGGFSICAGILYQAHRWLPRRSGLSEMMSTQRLKA